MTDIDAIWNRLKEHAGEEFKTSSGLPFIYHIQGGQFVTTRTDYPLPKSDFAKALAYVPIRKTADIQKLVRGPSYIFAVYNDPRIRRTDW
jgi:hypothetical protein